MNNQNNKQAILVFDASGSTRTETIDYNEMATTMEIVIFL